ncbi:LacI family DNA-binding transcriptional regulator [Pontibacter sp. HSC-36F09]|uniref:LacI family DNA-binding transcriptional regulator n=1 Tax=Pontibacter sp. HSC-36F09 TaxID=2910966 RepID=UPI00209FEF34|nr:LacI family DNA-binding transcriptional regulator [Pontibacter sp. HSC-36F09]MCP2043572.1 LacI family transcriptional regulator [Pontibacter sp. HSC-36F09]
MKPKRPSIKDIAANLNVSVTTVSFVLNGKGPEMRISEEVIQKILNYAKEINYTPNQLAQSLRTGKSNVIVFMVEDISNPFFARLARIIEVTAYKKGYKVIFCSNENDDRHTEELLQVFRDQKVTGYIIIPSAGAKKQIMALLEEDVPMILFDRYFPELETNYVVIDNENATYKATKHLIGNGYRNIGFVTIASKQTQMMDRLKGYSKAVKEAKFQSRVLELPFVDPLVGEGLMRNFFDANPELDAVFFATNYLTQRGLLVMREHFPGKLNEWGIMTFDDNEFFHIHTPSISAVAQPLEEIGNKLMEIMLELLKGEKKTVHQVVLKAELRERDSSRSKHASSI